MRLTSKAKVVAYLVLFTGMSNRFPAYLFPSLLAFHSIPFPCPFRLGFPLWFISWYVPPGD